MGNEELEAALAKFRESTSLASEVTEILRERKALANALKEASDDALRAVGAVLKEYGPAVLKAVASNAASNL